LLQDMPAHCHIGEAGLKGYTGDKPIDCKEILQAQVASFLSYI
jgi:hypothetical protein